MELTEHLAIQVSLDIVASVVTLDSPGSTELPDTAASLGLLATPANQVTLASAGSMGQAATRASLASQAPVDTLDSVEPQERVDTPDSVEPQHILALLATVGSRVVQVTLASVGSSDAGRGSRSSRCFARRRSWTSLLSAMATCSGEILGCTATAFRAPASSCGSLGETALWVAAGSISTCTRRHRMGGCG